MLSSTMTYLLPIRRLRRPLVPGLVAAMIVMVISRLSRMFIIVFI